MPKQLPVGSFLRGCWYLKVRPENAMVGAEFRAGNWWLQLSIFRGVTMCCVHLTSGHCMVTTLLVMMVTNVRVGVGGAGVWARAKVTLMMMVWHGESLQTPSLLTSAPGAERGASQTIVMWWEHKMWSRGGEGAVSTVTVTQGPPAPLTACHWLTNHAN